MYDKKYLRLCNSFSVRDLIEHLKAYPQDAQVFVCGDDYCFIHMETDGTAINIDTEDLEECYDDESTDEA